MESAHSHLKRCYAIRDGKIDPWGTIRILLNGVVDPGDCPGTPICVQTGLVVYSEKLVQYGNGQYRAKVLENTVQVYGTKTVNNSYVEEISHDKFLVVEIHEALVHDDGHLESYCFAPDRRGRQPLKKALEQAATGKKPTLLDNSPFVQVDKKFAGQTVIELSWELRVDHAAVFTKLGERIPSKVHHPLSYAKWEPKSEFAKYGVVDSVTN